MEARFGQVGRSKSLWLLSYRRVADFVVSNLRFNGATGFVTNIDLLLMPRVGHNFIDYPLEVIIGEARGCSSFLLDSYGR